MTLDTETALNNIFDVDNSEPKDAEVVGNIPVETTLVLTEKLPAIPAKTSLVPVEANTAIELSKEEKDAQEDYEFTRNSLKKVSEYSQEGVLDSIALAKSLDRPAGFEAVDNMVKATVEAHRALQELHKSAAEVRIASKTASMQQSTVNVEKGVVFAGTAEDLLRMIDTTRT